MRRLLVLALVAGCADPVVDMQLLLPQDAQSYDTSCITAVEVRLTGATYLQDSKDVQRACLEIENGTSYSAIRDAIRGRFEVAIPESGLSGVEIYGWSGPSACAVEQDAFFSPDLLFYGRGEYIGQDRIDIPVTHNLGCARSQLKVRMIDMFALAAGASCAEAGAMQAPAGVGAGTLAPRLFEKGARFFGNLAGAESIGNLATFVAPTQTGSRSCLALDGSDQIGGSSSCAIGGIPVCAAADEIELATVPFAITATQANYDATLMVKFPGLVYGSVWANGATKSPLAGATVDVDPAHGKVIYLDPPDVAGRLPVRADQSRTGPSGLFALYTDTVVQAKVSGNGRTREVTLGSANEGIAGALIVLP